MAQGCKIALLWERLGITHTSVSTSKTDTVLKMSVSQELELNKRVYNDIFKQKGRYDWIAETRTWIAVEKAGYDIGQLNMIGLKHKYNHASYKILYRLLYWFYRLRETYL